MKYESSFALKGFLFSTSSSEDEEEKEAKEARRKENAVKKR